MSQSLEHKHCADILNLYQEIESIIANVGFNDMKGSSEHLKTDFKELIGSLLYTNKSPIISVPLPSLNVTLNSSTDVYPSITGYQTIAALWVKHLLTMLMPSGNKGCFIRRMGSTQITWVPGSFHSIIRRK
jgi:hypothetical protein